MGSWERLGRTVGLLVLVATLSAASAGNVMVSPRASPVPAPIASAPIASAPIALATEAEPPTTEAEPATSSSTGPVDAGVGVTSELPFIVTHIVAQGETVSQIALRYGVSTSTVTVSSGVRNPDRIYPGQTMAFPSVDGVIYRVRSGDSLSSVATLHQVTVEAIAGANNISDPKSLQTGQLLVVPGGRVRTAVTATAGTSSAKATTPAASGGTLAWPVLGSVSSRFGPRWGHTHSGIDIAAAYETTIRAAAAGKVIFVGWYGQYGRCVILDHGGGLTTLYGHASSILVHTGDHVQRGDAIAEVGSSGNSTGPHLHFEVRVAGEPRNPLNYLGG